MTILYHFLSHSSGSTPNSDSKFENLRRIKVTDKEVEEYIELLLPVEKNATSLQQKNILKLREDMRARYFDAPDLQKVGNNAYRFVNAVSDFATHSTPLRKTTNYRENMFAKTIEGNPLIDRAYQLVSAA